MFIINNYNTFADTDIITIIKRINFKRHIWEYEKINIDFWLLLFLWPALWCHESNAHIRQVARSDDGRVPLIGASKPYGVRFR